MAHFFDIESGRKDLDLRGQGRAHERFDIPIPRDGGIQDLIAEARDPRRRFDAVICESIERVARRTYYGTKIEHELERAGVALFAEDLSETDTRSERARDERLAALTKRLAEIRQQRGDRLMMTLETQDDPEGTLFARVRDRVGDLAREEQQVREELRTLEAEVAATPVVEPALLDGLPTTPINLGEVPEPVLRPFLESFRLEIRYDRRTHVATGKVSLDEAAVSVTNALVSAMNGDEPDSGRFPRYWCPR